VVLDVVYVRVIDVSDLLPTKRTSRIALKQRFLKFASKAS
jgi:hypothetical protein